MWRMSDPRIELIKQLHRKLEQHDSVMFDESVSLIQVRQSLYFVNCSAIKETVNRVIQEYSPKKILLEMTCCNDIDSTGVHSLKDIVEICKESKIEIGFVGVQDSV